MNRSLRIFELVNLLAGRRGRQAGEIARHFGISERTVFRDLAALQERHIPVYHDEAGYRLMETAHLPPLNLTATEYALLKVALHNPALKRQASRAATLAALEAKLDAAIAHAEERPQALRLASIERSGPKAERAMELLTIAVEKRQPVEIGYQSLSGGTDKLRGLDPWQLFQRAGAWYVIGRCHIHDEPRIFRLDRIGAVKNSVTGSGGWQGNSVTGSGGGEGVAYLSPNSFEIPPDFDLERHLEDTWGMVQGRGRYKVVLRFEKSLAPLVLNARHHTGEKTKKLENGDIEYRVELSSLEEIARWVVGFGGKCRVVGPGELGERVKGLAEGVVGRDAAVSAGPDR